MISTIYSIAAMVLGLSSFANEQHQSTEPVAFHQTAVLQTSFSTTAIVTGYLKIKNALVKSDSKSAALNATALETVLNNSKVSSLSATQKTLFLKISEKVKKHTKAIAANSGKLDKQRKAFQQLSQNMNQLVTVFGTSQKLYQDYCPMYEDGSIWLSETKDIKNPYYGAQMLTCGILKETVE